MASTPQTSSTPVQSSAARNPINNPSGPFDSLTTDQINSLSLTVTSSLLPSTQALQAIANAFTSLGASPAQVTNLALELVNYCYDNGSSPETLFRGNSSIGVPFSKLASIISEHATLRQFARYFAPLIWNARISLNKPPAAWEAWHYNEEERFAAFDFFDGVLNSAALMPKDGLIRKPTRAEINASQTNRNVHLFENKTQKSKYLSNSALVTKGIADSEGPRVQFLPGPE
uniref:Coat protein n=4 Tax=Opuntia virus X TaxID=253702 RepID=A0A173G3G4_9VIRU|nr:coat protein [Opuntia virus X]ANH10875.1 coat protein [Opuntia virus X]ANH10877.1 coat protein [Opuntia virus X]ATU47240.1 coat protein [Opuntia virus X]